MKPPKRKPLPPDELSAMNRLVALEIGYSVLNGDYQLIQTDTDPPMPIAAEGDDLDALVQAVLAVGKQRGELLNAMRAALMASNDKFALELARQLCNLKASK